MSETQQILLGLIALFVAGLLVGRWRVSHADGADLRAIPAFDALGRRLRRAIEGGRAVHVALGWGGISGTTTADSLAGIEIVRFVAAQMAPVGQTPIVTVADATLLPLAQTAVCHPYRQSQNDLGRPAPDTRWLAPAPAAYAGGVMGILGSENVGVATLVGTFGDEYLLLGEAGVRHHVEQVGGTSDPTVLPFVAATANEPLLGEEIYAAGAYLAHKPWHLASLWAQDTVRWLIALAVLALVAANTVVW